MSATTWIGAVFTVVLLAAVVVWALVRHRRSAQREDWVALESIDTHDLDRDDDRSEPVVAPAADRDDDRSEPAAAPAVEQDEETRDDPSTTSADPKPVVLPDGVLDADGDLRANDEIAVVIDANGIVVALTKPARRRLDADTGAPHTELARMRPVAGAAEFDASHHPIARALEGEHVDRSPCVVETASATLAGVISAQPVMVEDDELVLVHFEVASAG